jgi:hypothetical protein
VKTRALLDAGRNDLQETPEDSFAKFEALLGILKKCLNACLEFRTLPQCLPRISNTASMHASNFENMAISLSRPLHSRIALQNLGQISSFPANRRHCSYRSHNSKWMLSSNFRPFGTYPFNCLNNCSHFWSPATHGFHL